MTIDYILDEIYAFYINISLKLKIKKYTYDNGNVNYRIAKKFLWFYINYKIPTLHEYAGGTFKPEYTFDHISLPWYDIDTCYKAISHLSQKKIKYNGVKIIPIIYKLNTSDKCELKYFVPKYTKYPDIGSFLEDVVYGTIDECKQHIDKREHKLTYKTEIL